MLTREQQWRRTKIRARSRSFAEVSRLQAAEQETTTSRVIAVASAPDLSEEMPPPEFRPQSILRNRTVSADSFTNMETPFRTIFPRFGSRRRVKWHTKINVRQIPLCRDMPAGEKNSIWWSSGDIQGFASAELQRLMSEGNIAKADSDAIQMTNGSPPISNALLPPAKSIEVATPADITSGAADAQPTAQAEFVPEGGMEVAPLADQSNHSGSSATPPPVPEVLAPAPKKVHSPSPKRRPILKPKLGKRPEGGVTGTAVEKVNGEGGKDELEDVSKHMKSPDDVSSIQQELEQLQLGVKMDKISREIEELRLDNQNMIKSPSSSTSSTDDADVGKKPPVHFFLQNPENTNAGGLCAW